MIVNTKTSLLKCAGFFSIIFLLLSCQKQTLQPETLNSLMAADSKTGSESLRADANTTQTSTCFSAIAQVSACAGEWIRFSGEIILRQTKTVNATGATVITRSFSVHDLSGVGVTAGSSLSAMTCVGTLRNGTLTGTTYTVAGGAEMFSIHFTEGGAATLGGSNTFIHRGTLVFVSNENGQRTIAMHIIRKVNGIVQENTWACHRE